MLTSPPTADDIAKRTAAADKLPSDLLPGSEYLMGTMRQGADQLKAGNTAQGVGTMARAAVMTPVHAVGESFGVTAAQTANTVLPFLSGATGIGSSTPDTPPPKAASAAGDAALMALGKGSVDQASDGPGAQLSPGYRVMSDTGPSGNTGDAAAWNKHVEGALASLTGYSPEKTRALLASSMPDGNKEAGEAAIRTTDGAPRRLNYGYGSEIIGSGKTDPDGLNVGQSGTNGMNAGPQRMNSYSGVGRGAMPEGAAGVFGPGNVPTGAPSSAAGGAGASATTPIEYAQQHIMSIMQQAEAKRARGDGLGAKSLENHAARLGALFTGLSEHAYRQGSLAHQARVTNLAEQQANPGIQIDRQIQKFIDAGDMESAARLSAVKKGSPPFQMQQFGQGMYGVDPYSADGNRTPFPYMLPTPKL